MTVHISLLTLPTSLQDIVGINRSIEEGTLASRPNVVAAFDRAKAGNGRLHFLGLVSDGGVHSHQTHLEAMLRAAKETKVPKSFVHFFADGRDTGPVSGGEGSSWNDFLPVSPSVIFLCTSL